MTSIMQIGGILESECDLSVDARKTRQIRSCDVLDGDIKGATGRASVADRAFYWIS